MKITPTVKKILENYDSDSPAILSNLYKFLMSGKLAGTGKMVILPVDQGFEHGPDRSFAKNQDAYDPLYHFELAIDAGLNGFAAPLGLLSCGAAKYAGQIPTILKLNSNNSLNPSENNTDQAFSSSVKDAVELGCSAVGITIYPGSKSANSMIEEAKEIVKEAKYFGLPTIIWSYPRGNEMSKEAETSLDVVAYAAHIACLIGGHIIKIKPPKLRIDSKNIQEIFNFEKISILDLSTSISHIIKSSFNGRRITIFSGGESKKENDILTEIKAIKDGGGFGSIIGRNSFQRPKKQALELLDNIIKIYKNQDDR